MATNESVVISREYGGYYYVRFAPEDKYDERMWKIDKRTKKAVPIHLMDYLDIADRTTPISPQIALRGFQNG